jgi:hypothetical protein
VKVAISARDGSRSRNATGTLVPTGQRAGLAPMRETSVCSRMSGPTKRTCGMCCSRSPRVARIRVV